MQEYEEVKEERDLSNLIIGGLLIIGIIFIIIIGITVTKKIREKEPEPELPEQQHHFEIKVFEGTERIYGLDYELRLGNKVVQSGLLEKNYKMIYDDVLNNTNYTLTLLTDEYYFEPAVCNIEEKDCKMYINYKAQPEVTYIDYGRFYRIIIYIKKGIFKDPAFCIQENSNKVVGLVPKLDDEYFLYVELPIRLKNKYDSCFKFGIKEELEKLFLETLMDDYDDLADYNEKHDTEYIVWDDIPVTQEDLINLKMNTLEEGFTEFEIYMGFDYDYEHRERDRINLLLMDEFTGRREFDDAIKLRINITG